MVNKISAEKTKVMVAVRMCLLRVIIAVFGCGVIGTIEANDVLQANTEMLERLCTELNEAGGRKESAEILGRIAALDSEVAKPFLLGYFKGLPVSQASTDAGSDVIKGAAFDAVLPLLKGVERENFLSEVLEADVKGWREAKRYHASNMYPSIMLRRLLKAFEEDGEMRPWREKLARLAKDHSLPEDARVLFSASAMRIETGVGKERVAAKIRAIINDLPIKTYAVIPWEFYRDKEKRIAYGKSDAFKRQLDRFDQWKAAGNLFKYETSENLLRSYGEDSIRELVAVIEHGNISREKRDSLAMLTGELLARISVGIKEGVKPRGTELPELANRLALYVDKMDDLGAFSHRDDAERGLSRFFENAGLPDFQFHSNRVGIDPMAAVTGMPERVVSPTNASPSQTVAAGHEKNPRAPFNIVWVTLALGGIPAALAGVWWACRRMKKKGSEE